jgi:alkylhydroperoxidase family enzyme
MAVRRSSGRPGIPPKARRDQVESSWCFGVLPENDVRANAPCLSEGKTASLLSGSCSKTRPGRNLRRKASDQARLPYLEKQDLPVEDQDLLAREINLLRVLVHSTKGARSFSTVGQFIRHQSRLDPRLREMAIIQVGYITRSSYEYSHHIKIGRDFGVSNEDIHAIARTVLRAAREMTVDLKLSGETFETLRANLDDECLTDLIITISFYNGVVRLLEALQVDVEDEYLCFLDEFPLPQNAG